MIKNPGGMAHSKGKRIWRWGADLQEGLESRRQALELEPAKWSERSFIEQSVT
jgi:hypothetical protein